MIYTGTDLFLRAGIGSSAYSIDFGDCSPITESFWMKNGLKGWSINHFLGAPGPRLTLSLICNNMNILAHNPRNDFFNPIWLDFTWLDFSQLWVWKRAVRFLPHEVISFRQKKWSLSEILKLQTGSKASGSTWKFQIQTFFQKVQGVQTSWILLNMVHYSTTSHF